MHDVSRPAAGQRCRHRRVLGVRDPPPPNVVRAALLVEVHAGVGVVVKPGGGIVHPPRLTAGWGRHVARSRDARRVLAAPRVVGIGRLAQR